MKCHLNWREIKKTVKKSPPCFIEKKMQYSLRITNDPNETHTMLNEVYAVDGIRNEYMGNAKCVCVESRNAHYNTSLEILY